MIYKGGVREGRAGLASRGAEGLERPFQTHGSERRNSPPSTGHQGEPGFSYQGVEGRSQGLIEGVGVSGDQWGVPGCTVCSWVLSRATWCWQCDKCQHQHRGSPGVSLEALCGGEPMRGSGTTRVFVGSSSAQQDVARRLAHWGLLRPSMCRAGRMLVFRLRSTGQNLTPSSELPSHTPLREARLWVRAGVGSSFPGVSLPISDLMLQVTPGWVPVAAVGIAAAGVGGAHIRTVHCTQPGILHLIHTQKVPSEHTSVERRAGGTTAFLPRVALPHVVLETSSVSRSWPALFILALF